MRDMYGGEGYLCELKWCGVRVVCDGCGGEGYMNG